MEVTLKSPAETEQLGLILGQKLAPGALVLLKGELGAGKTTLARGLARGMGVTEPVTSPTFSLLHCYTGRFPVYHLDAYRLEDFREARAAGLEEALNDLEGVALLEWGERILELLPGDYLEVELVKLKEENRRLARVTARGSFPAPERLVDK